jgi:adenylate cyclase
MLLYTAGAIHLVAGLATIGLRRGWRLSASDGAQLALGLLIPVLLAGHVIAIRGGIGMAGFYADFSWMMALYWKFAPGYGIRQIVVLVIVWAHGCIGLYSWLSLKPWWDRIAPFLYPVAMALPVLALLGFVEAGKEALRLLASDTDFIARTSAAQAKLAPVLPRIAALQDTALAIYAALVALVAALAAMRAVRRRHSRVSVAYAAGPTVAGLLGESILDASRRHDVPHADVCSGRGRCGTCRVRVRTGGERLSPAGAAERALLMRLSAEGDVRLACQAVLLGGAVEVERLVAPDVDALAARRDQARSSTVAAAASP